MRALGRAAAIAACMVGTLGTGAAMADAAWNPVATGGMNISDQVSLARTSDGILHVGWAQASNNTDSILQTPITAAGAVGSPVTLVSGWSMASDPALVAQGTTLTAFWPGSPTTVTGDPQFGLDMATSADAGATWNVSKSAIYNTDFVYGRVPAVGYAGGQWLQSFYGVSETRVHVGLNPATPSVAGYGEGLDQGMAVDAGGNVMVAWCQFLDPGSSVYVAPVNPATGAPAGPAEAMPDTGSCPAATRTQLVARPGGGFYIASESKDRTKVLVWQPGTPGVATLASGDSTKQQIALTTTPDGRLWAGWADSLSGKLTFMRSNKTVTKWGAAVSVDPPADQSVYQLTMDGQANVADAIIRTSNINNEVRLSSTQVQPGLTLQATGGQKQTFRVLDAGDPISGAQISVGGRTLTTDGMGKATTSLKKGKYTAKASKSGYVGATASVRSTLKPKH
jgi:hypothetical protein